MNYEALNSLMDGEGELAGAMVGQELKVGQLAQQLRFMNEVLADIYDLADPTSKTPLQNLGLIRTKASVATDQASKSGLLS